MIENYSKYFKRLLLFNFLIAITISCSSPTSTEPGEPTGINEPGIKAELGDETVMISENIIESALLEEEEDQSTYVFDAGILSGAGYALEQGGILLLEKKALRRITSVSENNGQITVRTSGDVSMEEAFRELEIDVSKAIRFSPDLLTKTIMDFEGQKFYPKDVENSLANWEYKVGAYNVKGSVQAEGNRATVKLEMRKNLAAGGVVFASEAVIEEMSTDLKLDIRNHETKSFDFQNKGMQGKVDLSIAAAGGGTDADFGFGPLAMFNFPFTIGPVPVMIVVKVQTVAKLHVRSQASATAKSSISYNGITGVSYDGTSYEGIVGGGIKIPLFGPGQGDSAPSGFDGYRVEAQYGFAAPVLEVQLFGNIIVPFIRPEFYIGSSFHWAPICKNTHVRYGVKAGMDLRFLGKKLTGFDNIELVEEVRQDGYSDKENCSHHYEIGKIGLSDVLQFF